MDNIVSLYLVDDHPALRAGLKAVFNEVRGFKIVGEASDRASSQSLLGATIADIALVDIKLPDCDGFEIVRYLRAERPSLQCCMYSMYAQYEYVIEAFASGASGYATKDTAFDSLELGLRKIMTGHRYLDDKSLDILVRGIVEKRGSERSEKESRYTTLTDREQQVFRMIAQGKDLHSIATALKISVKTVENHRAGIMTKLGANDRLDLVRFAEKLGIV